MDKILFVLGVGLLLDGLISLCFKYNEDKRYMFKVYKPYILELTLGVMFIIQKII